METYNTIKKHKSVGKQASQTQTIWLSNSSQSLYKTATYFAQGWCKQQIPYMWEAAWNQKILQILYKYIMTIRLYFTIHLFFGTHRWGHSLWISKWTLNWTQFHRISQSSNRGVNSTLSYSGSGWQTPLWPDSQNSFLCSISSHSEVDMKCWSKLSL